MGGLLAGEDGGEALAPGIVLWRGACAEQLFVDELAPLATAAPFRHMRTPGGRWMSVEMTNCGDYGWVSDTAGYRYAPRDPASDRAWPPIPQAWRAAARELAHRSGFAGFEPDACLVNRYVVGARMSAHQDRNEADFSQPVVSLSFGLSARFVFHGPTRSGPARVVDLHSGDALVWGGEARLHYHAVRPLAPGCHPTLGALRYNLTLRRAGAAA